MKGPFLCITKSSLWNSYEVINPKTKTYPECTLRRKINSVWMMLSDQSWITEDSVTHTASMNSFTYSRLVQATSDCAKDAFQKLSASYTKLLFWWTMWLAYLLAMFQFENSCPLIPLWRRNNNSVLWSLEGPFWHRDDDGNLCIVQRLAVQFHFLILQLQKLCWWTNLPVDMMNIHLNSYCEYCKWCSIWYIQPPPQKRDWLKQSSSCNLGLPWLKKTETRWCNNISMYQHRMDSPWGQCNVDGTSTRALTCTRKCLGK